MGIPPTMVGLLGKIPLRMDDLGVHPFMETPRPIYIEYPPKQMARHLPLV